MQERHKLSFFTDDIIVNIENLKEITTTKKLLKLVSIAMLQDTELICKSQLLFYVPAINKWNLKLKIQLHLYEHLKKKYYTQE